MSRCHVDCQSVLPVTWWQMESNNCKLSRDAKRYIRKVCGITIVFWTKDTIYVDGGDQRFIINRWFDTKPDYRRWCLLCNSLKRRNQLTMADIRSLALKHGFETCGFTSLPKGIEKLKRLSEEYEWKK